MDVRRLTTEHEQLTGESLQLAGDLRSRDVARSEDRSQRSFHPGTTHHVQAVFQ